MLRPVIRIGYGGHYHRTPPMSDGTLSARCNKKHTCRDRFNDPGACVVQRGDQDRLAACAMGGSMDLALSASLLFGFRGLFVTGTSFNSGSADPTLTFRQEKPSSADSGQQYDYANRSHFVPSSVFRRSLPADERPPPTTV